MLGFFFKASENLKTPLIGKTIGQEREMVTYMPREGGGGTRDFKWQGWSKDFFGFEIFDSRIFLGTKIWQVFFGVAWFE